MRELALDLFSEKACGFAGRHIGQWPDQAKNGVLLEPSDDVSVERDLRYRIDDRRPFRAAPVHAHENQDERLIESVRSFAFTHERIFEEFLTDQLKPGIMPVLVRSARSKHPGARLCQYSRPPGG